MTEIERALCPPQSARRKPDARRPRRAAESGGWGGRPRAAADAPLPAPRPGGTAGLRASPPGQPVQGHLVLEERGKSDARSLRPGKGVPCVDPGSLRPRGPPLPLSLPRPVSAPVLKPVSSFLKLRFPSFSLSLSLSSFHLSSHFQTRSRRPSHAQAACGTEDETVKSDTSSVNPRQRSWARIRRGLRAPS